MKQISQCRCQKSVKSGEGAFLSDELESTKKKREDKEQESKERKMDKQGTCSCHVARQLPQTADTGINARCIKRASFIWQQKAAIIPSFALVTTF